MGLRRPNEFTVLRERSATCCTTQRDQRNYVILDKVRLLSEPFMKRCICLSILSVFSTFLLVTGTPIPFDQQKPKQQAEEQEDKEPKTELEKAKRKEAELRACGTQELRFSARTDKKQHPTPEAPADKALIYVIRPTMFGNMIHTKLAVNGKWIGANRGNNYFFLSLEPGEHHFCSQSENRSLLTLEVEAGKTYYLQQKIGLGFWKARHKLVLLNEEEAKKGLAKCHLSISEEKK